MARDDVAQTEAQILALGVRRLLNHPAVAVAGLSPVLGAVVDYLAAVEQRLATLEQLAKEARQRG